MCICCVRIVRGTVIILVAVHRLIAAQTKTKGEMFIQRFNSSVITRYTVHVWTASAFLLLDECPRRVKQLYSSMQ